MWARHLFTRLPGQRTVNKPAGVNVNCAVKGEMSAVASSLLMYSACVLLLFCRSPVTYYFPQYAVILNTFPPIMFFQVVI